MIDEDYKKLSDSVGHILNCDELMLVAQLLQELHQRKVMCKQAKMVDLDKGVLLDHLKYHNERIKKILSI